MPGTETLFEKRKGASRGDDCGDHCDPRAIIAESYKTDMGAWLVSRTGAGPLGTTAKTLMGEGTAAAAEGARAR